MNKKSFAIASILIVLTNSNLFCDQIITFFFRPYPTPTINDKKDMLKKINKLSDPKKLSKYAIKSHFNDYMASGIFSTYDGYLTISDLNGQTILPRRHTAPQVNILVTELIVPIFMTGHTIHHWEIEKGTPAKMYTMTRIQDKETRLYFWDTKKTKIPESQRIDIKTIVILAKPKYIYIPEGATITTKNPQLHLPDVYVKKDINTVETALYTFGIKNFFQSMDYLYKKRKKEYSQAMRG